MHLCTNSTTVDDSLSYSLIELIPNIHTEESNCQNYNNGWRKTL